MLPLQQLRIHAHVGEPAVVEQVLHGHVAAEVAEELHAVVGTGAGGSVAEGRHFVSVIEEFGESFHALASGGHGGRLADGVHAHLVAFAKVIAKTAGEALEQGLTFRHFAVVGEGALGGDVAQGQDRTPVVHGILLPEHLHHLVERDG